MFNLKYRYPHCKLLPDSTIDHVYFLTCINSRNPKTQRLVLLTTSLDKLHTSPQFCNIIVYHTDNYYNNDLLLNLPTTKNTLLLEVYITNQTSIGWVNYIRGCLTSSFHPVINQYYRTHKLGRQFHSSVQYRTIIRLLWKIHNKAWLEYCDSVHVP